MVTIPLFIGLKNHPNLVVQDFATIHSIMEIAMLPCIICRWRMLVHGWWPPWMPRKKHGETWWGSNQNQHESTRDPRNSLGFWTYRLFHGATMCHGQLVRFHPRSLWCHESGNSGNPPVVHHPDHQYQTRIASSTGPLFTLFVSTWGHWHVSGTVDRRWAGGSEALGLL